MKAARVFSYLSGCIALVVSVFLFQERQLIGFPDGFVTEQDRVRRVLLAISSGVSLLTALGLFSLGWVGPQRTGKKLLVADLAYGAFVALTVIVDQHLRGASGAGG